jgi:hypothetical protein
MKDIKEVNEKGNPRVQKIPPILNNLYCIAQKGLNRSKICSLLQTVKKI